MFWGRNLSRPEQPLREWSGEPSVYDHFAEERRPSKIQHSFFLHLPCNQETWEFDAEQRRLWDLLYAARCEMPRDFNKIQEIQDNINAHLIKSGEPRLQFPPLKQTFREYWTLFLLKFKR